MNRTEIMQNFIPKNAAWQCVGCKKHIPFTVTCKAYPAGIPKEIKTGKATCKRCCAENSAWNDEKSAVDRI